MKKYMVEYAGGESRYSNASVDYMLVEIEHAEEKYELYAEIEHDEVRDENGEPVWDTENDDWNPACNHGNPECASVRYLRQAMREMCKEIGFDFDALDFDGFEDDSPLYPGVEARYSIS